MGSLAASIRYENLIACKKLLADARISDVQRQMLLRLLTEEKTKYFHEETSSRSMIGALGNDNKNS